MVLYQNKPLAEPAVEHWPDAAFLVGGSPIAARSIDVSGLQVADMAAWSINQCCAARPCFDDGTAADVRIAECDPAPASPRWLPVQ